MVVNPQRIYFLDNFISLLSLPFNKYLLGTHYVCDIELSIKILVLKKIGIHDSFIFFKSIYESNYVW